MSAKNWNFYYKGNDNGEHKALVMEAVCWGSTTALLWLSFYAILRSVFSELAHFQLVPVVLLTLCLWLPESGFLAHRRVNKWQKYVTRLCVGARVMLSFGYLLWNWEAVKTGAMAAINQYLELFNVYKGTTLAVPEGDADSMVVFMTAVTLILWHFLWGLSCMVRQNTVLLAFPITALVALFMVGRSPDEAGLVCMFLAGFLLLLPTRSSLAHYGTVLIASYGALLLAGALFQGDKEDLHHLHLEMQTWVESFTENSPKGGVAIGDGTGNKVTLDNVSPLYTGQRMLHIETSGAPRENIYLREYYGTNYQNGTWTMDTESYEALCKSMGKNPMEEALQLAGRPYKVSNGYWDHYDISIYSLSDTNKTAYIPYFADYNSLDVPYEIFGDYLFKQAEQGTEIQTRVTFPSRHYTLEDMMETLHEEVQFDKNYELVEWYNRVAVTYTASYKDIAGIAEAIDEIYTIYKNDDLYEYYGNTNAWRLSCVYAVQRYLERNITYSLDLDGLPEGMDPVSYMLTESREGFCMHYASAATLILQSMNIPARYASGYVVLPQNFESNGEVSIADIRDYNRHAWVEIYLDNFGWVPIEVTGSVGPQNQDEPMRPLPTPESSETQKPTVTEKPSEPEKPSETPKQSETQKESEVTQEPKKGRIGSGWYYLAGIALVTCAGVGTGCYCYHRYQRALEDEINRKKGRRAVRRINHRLYRTLRRKNWRLLPKNGVWTDAEYGALLAKTFTEVSAEDWARYMQIAEKMRYSGERITQEDMLHCYACYQKIHNRK